MRKVTLALFVALYLVFSFAFNVSAHTIQATKTTQNTHKMGSLHSLHSVKGHPNASGGGCSSSRLSTYRDISGKACISFQSPDVLPDGYVSYQLLTNHGAMYDCSLDLVLYHNNQYVTDQFYNCTSEAKRNAKNFHYGPLHWGIGLAFGGYTSRIEYIDLEYNDGFSSILTTYYSPIVNVP
jgi:hypothetical protein